MKLSKLSAALICAAGVTMPFFAESASTAALAGSVMSTDNAVVAAEVTAYRQDVQDGTIHPHAACFTSVTVHGNFLCGDLEGGTYILVFTLQQPSPQPEPMSRMSTGAKPPTSYAALAATPREGNVALFAFYPELSNWQLPNLIHVVAGHTETVNVTVDSSSTSSLEAEPATAVLTGKVQLFAAGEGFEIPLNMQARVNASHGTYLWEGIPSGRYKLIEDWSVDGQSRHTIGKASVDVSSASKVSFQAHQH